MSKSSNKSKVDCLMVYLKTLKYQSKPKHLKEEDRRPEHKVDVKGFKTR